MKSSFLKKKNVLYLPKILLIIKQYEHRQRKREAEEADKVEVAPGVTVASLRRFTAALIGPTLGLPQRCRLCR